VADLESKLASRSAELAASKKLVEESEAREEAAFQVLCTGTGTATIAFTRVVAGDSCRGSGLTFKKMTNSGTVIALST
jgi:hypothetical protein